MPFLALPLEIRRLIYQYALPSTTILVEEGKVLYFAGNTKFLESHSDLRVEWSRNNGCREPTLRRRDQRIRKCFRMSYSRLESCR